MIKEYSVYSRQKEKKISYHEVEVEVGMMKEERTERTTPIIV